MLASQLIHLGSQLSATGNRRSSQVSNRSHLSLRGPGTSLADDPDELHQPVPLNEDDSDIVQEENSETLQPPSRLVLQLVGLVENAVRQTRLPQMRNLWLHELALAFGRLEQWLKSEGSGPQAPLNDARKTIDWMGTRIMREFQVRLTYCFLNLTATLLCFLILCIGSNDSCVRGGVRWHPEILYVLKPKAYIVQQEKALNYYTFPDELMTSILKMAPMFSFHMAKSMSHGNRTPGL